MKTLSRLFTAVFILFAAACGTKEIDHPDNPDNPQTPDTPQDSEFAITASIVKTRVIYSDDPKGGFLDQKWQVGDVLFGYYDEKVDNKIVFNVSYVSDENGVATLVVDDEYKEKLASLTEGVAVDLVYTGSDAEYDDEAGTIKTVTMTGQTGSGKIPACMHSKATVVKEDGIKKLDFKFINDCAIFEIESLTGISAESTLNSVTISSLYPSGKYSFDAENGFTFAGTDTPAPQDINLGSSWKANSGGYITYYNEDTQQYEEHPVFIAVAPIADEGEGEGIKVTADIQGVSPAPSFTYSKNTLQSGCCYVISKREVVARTIDGECHETVAAAFDWAENIIKTNLSFSGRENVVTLIKDHIIDGLGIPLPEKPIFVPRDPSDEEDYDSYYWDKPLKVNSEITLDLNGCILSIPYEEHYVEQDSGDWPVKEYFSVASNGKLTVKDSKSGGTLESRADCHLITNEGVVDIGSGTISHNNEWDVVSNSGTLYVSGGKLQSGYFVFENNKGCEAYISGGELSTTEYDNGKGKEGYIVIDNYGTLEVSGGTLCNVGRTWNEEKNKWSVKPVIWNDPGAELTVKGTAVLSSTYGSVVYNESYSDDACTIEGGTLSSVNDNVVENYGECDIEGGTLTSTNSNAIYSGEGSVVIGTEDGDDDDITITSNSTNNTTPAIYIAKGSFIMHSGTVIGADAGGAVEINGMQLYSPYGIIDGGTIISNAYHALVVTMLNSQAYTTVSGGIFKSLGNDVNSTIHVDEGYLIIQWPEDVSIPSSYQPTSGSFPTNLTATEPLIINMSLRAQPVDVSQRAPVGSDNVSGIYSKVQIDGGYIYACNYGATGTDTSAKNEFYKDPTTAETTPVVLTSCGQFFSNVYSAEYYGSATGAVQFYNTKITSGMPTVVDKSLWPTGAGEPTWYYIYEEKNN